MDPNITQLAQYGLAGVCIALILLVGFIIHQISKLLGNHMAHETEAWNKNTEVLTKLASKIDQDIKANFEMAKTLKALKNVVKR